MILFMEKLIITTSREPSRRTRSFVKDLVKTIPQAEKFNRGKATLLDLSSIARRKRAYAIMMILEKKANPSAIVHYEPTEGEAVRKKLIRITSVKLTREIREYQTPLNINTLVIYPIKIPDGLPAQVADALIQLLRPKIIHGTEEVPNAIEIVVGGDEEYATVSFICTNTGRPCGPQFKAFKVIHYEQQ